MIQLLFGILSKRTTRGEMMSNWISAAAVLVACIVFTVTPVDGKTCPVMSVTGAEHWTEYNGLYNLTDRSCNGRNVWIQVNKTSQRERFIYYYNPEDLRYGWIISSILCSPSINIYGWNTHKRPDYILRNWMEYIPSYNALVYNTNLKVQCTEGLTYGAIVGIIVGCIVGAPILIIATIYIVKTLKRKKKPNARRPPARRTTRPPRPSQPANRSVQTSRDIPEGGTTNVMFDPDLDLPPYTLEPPSYEDINTYMYDGMAPLATQQQPNSANGLPPVTPPVLPPPGLDSTTNNSELPLTPPSYEEIIASPPETVNVSEATTTINVSEATTATTAAAAPPEERL